jgi:plasmid stabilization system protein ParE
MSTREQLVDALHASLVYVQATSDIDGIWKVTGDADLKAWRRAREKITEVIRLALAADNAERN